MFRHLSHLRRVLSKQKLDTAQISDKKAPTKSDFLARFEEFRDVPRPEIDLVEEELGFRLDKSWVDDLALHTQIVLKNSEANWSHGRVLYSYLRHRLNSLDRQGVCYALDTGTARGFSALVMARALLDSGRHGNIFTLDTLPHEQEIFSNCIDGVDRPVSRREIWAGWAAESERVVILTGPTSDTLRSLKVPRICFAFLDAQHDYESVMEEYRWVSSSQKSGDVIVMDDVAHDQFPGVGRAFEEIGKIGLYSTKKISSSTSRSYGIATRK